MILEKTDIFKQCPYYDDIVNSLVNDDFSISLINDYQEFVLDDNDKIEFIKLVNQYDKIMYKYITDIDFRKFVIKESEKLETTFIEDLRIYLIEMDKKYDTKKISNIHFSKWL